MFKRAFYILVPIALVSLAFVACGGGGEAKPTPTRAALAPTRAAATPAVSAGGALEVTLADKGQVYRFKPAEFSFKVGQKVRIKLTSENEFHTFTVPGMPTQEGKEVNEIVNGGQTVSIEFTPSRAGSYKLTCLPHETLGMVGTITITQ